MVTSAAAAAAMSTAIPTGERSPIVNDSDVAWIVLPDGLVADHVSGDFVDSSYGI